MSSKPKKLVTWDREAESRKIFEKINKNHIGMLISLSRPEFYVDFPNDVPKHLEFPGRGLSNKPKVGPKRSGDKAMLEAKEFLGGDIDEPRRRSYFSGSYNIWNMWKEVDAQALEETPKDRKRSRQSSSCSTSSSSYNKRLYAGSIGSKPCCTLKAKVAAGIDIDIDSEWSESFERPKHLQAKRIDVFTSSSSSESEDEKPAEAAVGATQEDQEAAAGATVDVQQEGLEAAAVDGQQEVQHSPKLIEPAESSDAEDMNESDNEDLDEESDKDQETDDDEDSAKDEDYHPSTSVAALFKKPVVKAGSPEPKKEPIYTVELDELKIKLR